MGRDSHQHTRHARLVAAVLTSKGSGPGKAPASLAPKPLGQNSPHAKAGVCEENSRGLARGRRDADLICLASRCHNSVACTTHVGFEGKVLQHTVAAHDRSARGLQRSIAARLWLLHSSNRPANMCIAQGLIREESLVAHRGKARTHTHTRAHTHMRTVEPASAFARSHSCQLCIR